MNPSLRKFQKLSGSTKLSEVKALKLLLAELSAIDGIARGYRDKQVLEGVLCIAHISLCLPFQKGSMELRALAKQVEKPCLQALAGEAVDMPVQKLQRLAMLHHAARLQLSEDRYARVVEEALQMTDKSFGYADKT